MNPESPPGLQSRPENAPEAATQLAVSPDDKHTALAAARKLAEHGVPLFLARPDHTRHTGHHNTGYWLPTRWQQTVADPAVVDRWRPGLALCAVTGHTVDLLDIDTHKGGGVAALNGTMPRSYGRTATPSGGTHDFIAGLGQRSKDGVLPGVDVKSGEPGGAGRGFAFLPPTVKRSKVDGTPRPYRWLVPPHDLSEAADDGSGAALAALLARDLPVGQASYAGPDYDALSGGQRAMADAEVERRITWWQTHLADAADWPEGETDDKGRGWEALTRDLAWSLALLAAAPWTGVTDDRAEALYADVVPDVMLADPKCAGKWTDATLAKAYDHPVDLPPWDGFEPVDDEPVDTGGAGDGGSWQPVDLGATLDGLLAGTLTRPKPTIAMTAEGYGLFYPGRVNGVHGDSSAGKTWTALVASREVLADGSVVYVDLEDDPAGVVGRLLTLGVEPDAIRRRFHYLQPDERLGTAALAVLLAHVRESKPGLVVIDSTGESLALQGARPNDDDDVARWFRLLPRRVAALGPAVVVLDHMPKGNGGELWPIGSQRKRAAITGAQYHQEVRRPFSADRAGYSVLVCAKDRHGNYRQGQAVATLGIDPERDELASLHSVADAADDSPELRESKKAAEVWSDIERTLQVHGSLSLNKLAEHSGRSKNTLGPVVTDRVELGELVLTKTSTTHLLSLPTGGKTAVT